MSVLHVLVRGRVQGVGFRWFVAGQARALGVAGWVRNTDDGAVEVAARGDDTSVGELRRRLSQGPPSARVDHVEDLPDVDVVRDEFLIQR